MPDWSNLVLIALALWVLYPLALLIANWCSLMRVPLWPVRLMREDQNLAPDTLQLAMIAEVESLGFRRIAARTRVAGPDSHNVWFFRHQFVCAFAVLSFEAERGSGYPVFFSSFDSKSNLLSTCNRAQHRALIRSLKERWHDPYANSLAAHWQAHLARADVQACKQVCDTTALVFLSAAIEAEFTRLCAGRCIRKSRNEWHYTAIGAARLSIAFLRARRKLAIPYSCVLTDGPLRGAYLAKCRVEQDRYKGHRQAEPALCE